MKAPSSPVPTHTPPPAAASTPQGKDFATAWDCLTDPKKAANADALSALLDELGVSAPDDLQYVETEQFLQLAALLKPIPQKKFKSSVGI